MRVPVLSVSAFLPVPPDRLYAILADYRDGHPEILPRPPFVSLEVEEGGIGEGTVIRVEMKVLGLRQEFRGKVTEPDPGRVLVESNDTGYTTSFTVDPSPDTDGATVTISTVMEDGTGLRKALERRLTARLLKPVYQQELALLARRAGAGNADIL